MAYQYISYFASKVSSLWSVQCPKHHVWLIRKNDFLDRTAKMFTEQYKADGRIRVCPVCVKLAKLSVHRDITWYSRRAATGKHPGRFRYRPLP